MTDLTYVTAGESHGKGILALIEGLPAGLEIDFTSVNETLAMRQKGYGRGGRQKIESDRAEALSGMKGGRTLGTPLALWVANRDAKLETLPRVRAPRPGHADLAGCLKTGSKDARDILERSSARETAGRTAAGAVAAQLIGTLGVNVFAHVTSLGEAKSPRTPVKQVTPALIETREGSPVRCLDDASSREMMRAVDRAGEGGDSLGGVVEAVAVGAVPGVGGFDRWENRLDARIAAAMMGIPAVKGVEIGLGFSASEKPGRDVHDEIHFNPALVADGKPHGFFRASNRAGGLEGGMTNGEAVVVRVALKPIPTLKKPLKTVDLDTGRGMEAAAERSDVCAVPSAAIIVEAVLAFEMARAYREKFGGDSTDEMQRNYRAYVESLRGFIP